MTRARRTWWIYAIATFVVVGALVWVSLTVMRLEASRARARSDAQQQEQVRLALWRMDSWMAPILAREAARPDYHYLPYFSRRRGFQSEVERWQPGEVLEPSPLLSAKPDFVRVYFQIDGNDAITSPQVPTGALLDAAVSGCLPSEEVPRYESRLQQVVALVQSEAAFTRIEQEEERERRIRLQFEESVASLSPVKLGEPVAQSLAEFNARNRNAYQSRQTAQIEAESLSNSMLFDNTEEELIKLGPLISVWLGEDKDQLFFLRRVRTAAGELLQGMQCDWPRLQELLLLQLDGIVAGATVVPAPSRSGANPGMLLASIPATLSLAAVAEAISASWSAERAMLLVTWIGVLAAIAGVGLTLRSSLEFGERRSRFASAVTHELRTPLTTFRMYSEMLADGMVSDPKQRFEYLTTLRDESERLSTLVENVLSYARLEDGRARTSSSPTTLAALVEHIRPMLQQRAETAGMNLIIKLEDEDDELWTDREAVGQILFNLIDNSCKYARSQSSASTADIVLTASRNGDSVAFLVHDHGPGIGARQAKRIFDPFERCEHNDDATPGVGIGLPVARGLARDLGGDLWLEPGGGGARFHLRIPRNPPTLTAASRG